MQQNTFQNSPGVLNKNYAEVDTESITCSCDHLIFTTPSTFKMPLLAKNKGKFFCLSGEEFIHDAISKNQKSLHCVVEDHENDSMIELAFRKVGFRMVPEGGRCSYGEKVRAIKWLRTLIENFSENIITNSHGGDRRSENSHNDGDNLADMIGSRLQLDRDTINSYLNYSWYLNNETLNFLAVEKATKRFFEKAHVLKRQLMVKLQAQSTSEEEMTSQISAKMQQWHHIFIETGRITDVEE
ncbi:MAG: hypothetical protein KAW01_00465, partial [Deltaproteobacteria bacterium]|nr:hypothetical protein [Deltaproteobacteria bacterium]